MALRLLNLQLSTRTSTLVVLDAVACVLALYGAAFLRLNAIGAAGVASVGSLWIRALLFAGLTLLSLTALGLYQSRAPVPTRAAALRIALAFAFTGLLLALLFYAIPPLYLGRGVLALSVGFGLVLVLALHIALRRPLDRAVPRRTLLVLGAGERARQMLAYLPAPLLGRTLELRGFVPLGEAAPAADLPAPLLPAEADLPALVRSLQIDEIVLAADERRDRLPMDALLECKLQGVAVTEALAFLEREARKVPLALLQPSWIILNSGFSMLPFYPLGKRLLDLLMASVLTIAAAPLMLLAALAIRLEDGGPVLYAQSRVGRHGRTFRIHKFRSMVVDAERRQTPQWASTDDPRITRIGRVLRKYRIDELPQVFNVLRGEMSFVGPRPERPEFVEQLAARIPYYRERHRVLPGITGWAQLNYPYGGCERDALEKLQYELYYLKHPSLLFDFLILLQTVDVVIFGKGAR